MNKLVGSNINSYFRFNDFIHRQFSDIYHNRSDKLVSTRPYC